MLLWQALSFIGTMRLLSCKQKLFIKHVHNPLRTATAYRLSNILDERGACNVAKEAIASHTIM